ncbi:hypothetical protein KSS87_020158 [Heliosperma pusillum]|nr:hypothetical protein KSS87_020158 [Heliosperma pusillum]
MGTFLFELLAATNSWWSLNQGHSSVDVCALLTKKTKNYSNNIDNLI